MARALSDKERAMMDAYWRASNYLSVGQIYLYDNPLLRQPLTKEHIKPRLLGHWGTSPGLNFIYVHLNRIIKKHDLDMIYITGPGHGGPSLVAQAYLEGTYSEVYPNVSPDEQGMKRLFTQFSFPGGIPSHVAPETPGSNSRRRRTRVRAFACLWSSVRQSRFDCCLRRRRRRGGDWSAGNELAF
jgi:xylulose-5-phosphate/fructose-6-phosphate phosphoketolase